MSGGPGAGGATGRARGARAALLGLGLAVLTTCARDLEAPAALPALDEPFFRCKVQPILSASCAFFRCHGDGRRFMRLFARNRLRLGGTEDERNGFLSPAERQANYDAARAMVDPERPLQSLLLRKPLDVRAPTDDGRFHRGQEIFGGPDVFEAESDPQWKVLQAWVMGATLDPACTEPGSDL